MKKKQNLVISLILLILLGVSVLYYLFDALFIEYKVNNNLVVINQGESVSHMVYEGGLAPIIHHRRLFYYLVRILNIDKHIVPGIYALQSEENMFDLLLKLRRGHPTFISFTILSGTNFSQLKKNIDNLAYIIHTTKDKSEQEIAKMIHAPYDKLEGLMYPDTYYISPNQTDLEIYLSSYKKMQEQLYTILKQRNLYYLVDSNLSATKSAKLFNANLPYNNLYQVLIMASLIEKETSNANDMQKVATVFINRLKHNMSLQNDPAVFYGLRHKKTITRSDFKIDTPYNTYIHHGLPPTPICIPSMAAVIASITPINDPNVLFFVADSKGNTIFSKTYEQHQKNIMLIKHK